jgi:hypothetical protein
LISRDGTLEVFTSCKGVGLGDNCPRGELPQFIVDEEGALVRDIRSELGKL